mmetsp:Transcript_3365/g.4971  ORF Transcript_3365/g.4971 Transcript_3365/m.4971 type:complete len:129 (-) Transcript_3365:406-792(-)
MATEGTPVPKNRVLTGKTEFDNVLLRDVKLRELPGFLKSNLNYNGVLRVNNFMTRVAPSWSHPNVTRRFWIPLVPVYLISFFVTGSGTYVKHRVLRDVIIKAKYGEAFNELNSKQQSYIKHVVGREIH